MFKILDMRIDKRNGLINSMRMERLLCYRSYGCVANINGKMDSRWNDNGAYYS